MAWNASQPYIFVKRRMRMELIHSHKKRNRFLNFYRADWIELSKWKHTHISPFIKITAANRIVCYQNSFQLFTQHRPSCYCNFNIISCSILMKLNSIEIYVETNSVNDPHKKREFHAIYSIQSVEWFVWHMETTKVCDSNADGWKRSLKSLKSTS